MSTSPSWFDQEKFSRLVKKKVGSKNSPASEPLPTPEQAEASQSTSSGLLDVDKPKTGAEKAPSKEDKSPGSLPEATATSGPVSLKAAPAPQPEATTAPASDSNAEPIRAPVEPNTPKVAPLSTGPRSVPTLLPRRTAPLPALKSLFQYEVPPAKPVAPPLDASTGAATETSPIFEAPKPAAFNEDKPLIAQSFKPSVKQENFGVPVFKEEPLIKDEPIIKEVPVVKEAPVIPQSSPVADDLASAWEKISELNEEVLRANRERDEALDEMVELRLQLNDAGQASPGYAPLPSHGDELLELTRERNEALEEANNLREELRQARESAGSPGDLAAQAEEITLLTEERDQSRQQYATLREDYENLKQEQIKMRGESGEGRVALEQELAKLRQESEKQLLESEKHKQEINTHKLEIDKHKKESEKLRAQVEEKDREIYAVKNSSLGMDDSVNALKKDIAGLKEQLTQVKEEASVAQRGLTLSQKALQETRDALREATEGSVQTKANFENLKKECSTLVQQNMLLQAQNDQVSRDLSAVKAKLNRG